MAWKTTFYYKEELKSEYMNHLMVGVFAPGVYNPELKFNLTDTNVTVGAGTTLVFSNCYDTERRNLDYPGSYCIKTVSITDSTETLTGFDSTKTRQVVAATISFNGSSNLTSTPYFFCCAPDQTIESEVKYTFGPEVTTGSNRRIYDLDEAYSGKGPSAESPNSSYLIIGELVKNGTSYDFVAAGMPDYRHSMLAINKSDIPCLMPTDGFSKFALNTPGLLMDGYLFADTSYSHIDSLRGNTPASGTPVVEFDAGSEEDGIYVTGVFLKVQTTGSGSAQELVSATKRYDFEGRTYVVYTSGNLDLSLSNRTRLISMLKNTSYLNDLMEIIKDSGSTVTNTIVPIAIGFRKHDSEWKEGCSKTNIAPCNMLNMFDLSSGLCKCTTASALNNNAFFVTNIL